MLTSSKKGKGRRLQNFVAKELLKLYERDLTSDDIRPAIMGQSGNDIKFSSMAKTIIPIDIECKNVEKINIWSAILQAEANAEPTRVPVVIFSKNRSGTYVCMSFEDFLSFLQNSSYENKIFRRKKNEQF